MKSRKLNCIAVNARNEKPRFQDDIVNGSKG